MINLNLNRWHIELTSKCQVQCPRCPRTEQKGKYEVVDLSLELLQNLFENLPKSENREVLLCGNLGDPIYHSDFHEILAMLKDLNLIVKLNTNGAGKDSDWWQKTISILDKRDEVILSLDGLENTNSVYRKGAKWETIERIFPLISSSRASFIWKFIVFKQNEKQIEEVKSFASEVGFTNFLLVKSNRFGEGYGLSNDDPLMPSPDYISHPHKGKSPDSQLRPMCLSDDEYFSKGLYVNALGHFSLCCWSKDSFFYNSPFDDQEIKFDLKVNSINEILTSEPLQKIMREMKVFESAPAVCKRFCSYKSNSANLSSVKTNSMELIDLQEGRP